MIDLYFVLDLADINGVKEAFKFYKSTDLNNYSFYWDRYLRTVVVNPDLNDYEIREDLSKIFSRFQTKKYGKESEAKFVADVLASLTTSAFV